MVRACEKTYEENMLREKDIIIHELKYVDGDTPPDDLIA